MKLLEVLAVLMAGVLLVGFLYQWIGGVRDRRRFAGEGRWIDIGGGNNLYLLEKGSGGPTVLFESGIAATNLNWFHIQENVAQFTGTASYDRFGLGWSSPSSSPRTPGNIAGELHAMLERAGIEPPYVLVGHSFGGLVVRRFAIDYPEEVASVVLVDPMRCDEWPPVNPDRQAEVDRGRRLSNYAIPIARIGLARLAITSALCRSGLISRAIAGASGQGAQHVFTRVTEEVGKMPREVWPAVAAHWSSPSYYAGMRSHVASVPDSVREMLASEPIRDIPVLLLTPEKSTPLSEGCLSLIGDNVTQVIAPRSAHWIHLDQPDFVIDSIRTMVAAARPEPAAITA
ncbi:MAG TPA: alpha/beta hydrolase [Terracidiphilus sp.]|jgi:pimeloyl-ACP methyl ester carboxylesterase|nr:alpha/beta hydrolase [Terracidiphilus sp.]